MASLKYSLVLLISTCLPRISAEWTSSSPHDHRDAPQPNLIAGTWSLVRASSTTNGTTTAAFGAEPVGILIFAPTMYFSELISVDPNTLPRFASNEDRTSGTLAEDAAVVDGTLGQIGTYTVNRDGSFQSETIVASTFPNWSGLYRNTSSLNETVMDGNRYMEETLHDTGSATTVAILWERK